MKKLFPLFAVIVIASCCKAKIEFDFIRKISFVDFSINEVDTFYVLPIYKDSVISFSDYASYQETTSSLETNLTKTSLDPFKRIEIVLKDTSKHFLIDSVISHSEKLGKGRCAGSRTIIDGYRMNSIIKKLHYIEVIK